MNKNQGFDIQVVEDHNEALNAIYQYIGAKRLDFDHLVLVHFDSHPDLGIPAELEADQIYQKETLLNALSIENWIIPAVYAGHLDTVVWVKPPWSTQIDSGCFKFSVGKDKTSGRIRCSCSQSYFISDGNYVNPDSLDNKRELTLLVCAIDDLVSEKDEQVYQAIQRASQANGESKRVTKQPKRVVLDIDLDFFSTQDPFKLMFKDPADFELFKQVYFHKQPSSSHPDFDSLYKQFQAERATKLASIWSILSQDESQLEDDHLTSQVRKLKKAFLDNQIDMELIHDYGSCIDDRPLPHHVSDTEEIGRLMGQFDSFLEIYLTGMVKPNLVTIARSSLDDYCPVDQVDQIQQDTVDRLTARFGAESVRSVVLNYLMTE